VRRSLIRFAVFPYQCRLGALTYWSATVTVSPPWSVRDEADQALRRPPIESRLNVLLSQASHFQKRADPANAMGIFPKELRRAQFLVDLIRVRLAKTLNQHAHKKHPPVGICLGVLSLLRAFWSIAATLILIRSSRAPPQSEKELVSNG
jgi:hypothetical protein